MAYTERMNSTNPGCIIIMIDQSGSMDDPYANDGLVKKDLVALSVNRFINETVEASSDGEGIKDRCFMCVIGYGTKSPGVKLILGDMISKIAENPIRVEQVKKKISDGAGGLVEIDEGFPIWLDAVADWCPQMDIAFQRTAEVSEEWCKLHPNSFPPLVINITDGQIHNKEQTKKEAERLRAISNNDGNVLLFNAYIGDGSKPSISFPYNKNELDTYSEKFLFDISSILPGVILNRACITDETINTRARGLICNNEGKDFMWILNLAATSIAR